VKRLANIGAVCALLLVFWLQMFLTLPKLSATTDEVAHLPAGYTYWLTRDFRLNPEHPPLAKLIASAPLLALKPKLDLSWPEWQNPQEYIFGYGFLYTNNADRLLFWARLPMTLLATLGGLIVFLWARDMFGNASGLFALGLYAFSPNLLAHGMLVTTDVPVAVFMTLALYLYWKFGEQPSMWHSIGIGLATGAAMATKFSGAILPILLIAFSASRVFSAADRRRQAIDEARWLAVAGLSALVVIEAAYLFSITPWTYFQNLRLVNRNRNPVHISYLFGNFSRNRFWQYFVLAFSVKATIALLLTTAFAIIHACLKRFIDARGELLLLGGIAFYAASLTLGADDLGVRYLLPVFVWLFIWGSRIARELKAKPVGIALLLLLFAWQARAALGAFPNYIPYFNEIAGGAKGGIYYLDDSNVDWGQGMKQTAAYINTHHLQNVELLPFSPFDCPQCYGMDKRRRDDLETYRMMISENRHPGTYIVSAHHLVRMMYIRPEWNPRNAVDRIGDSMWVFRF
jgi:predicted membrane-bound dolichyl-phosphate-mannose-protein mannosyltransferase